MAKGPDAFRTISEAADEVGAPQHVLRFWESKFAFITPMKRAGGRRFYRPQDVAVLKAIRRLLHDQGLTIKGVQRLHREQGLRRLVAYADPQAALAFDDDAPAAPPVQPPAPAADTGRLRQVLADLEGARARLEAVLGRAD